MIRFLALVVNILLPGHVKGYSRVPGVTESPGLAREKGTTLYKASSSVIQRRTLASDGMRKSPRGEKLTGLILGPSGMQDRLNCWLKNLQ